MCRRVYRRDLTDDEWTILQPKVQPAKPGDRPLRHNRRELIDAMSYVLRVAYAWRQLPHDLPPWQTVHHYFRPLANDGNLCPDPSGAAKNICGYEGAKKVNGRTRHLLVDSSGLLLSGVVPEASLADRDGARRVLEACS